MNQKIQRHQRSLVRDFDLGRDEGGVALLSALLFIILISGISVILVSVVLNQTFPANLAQKSTKTIYAAQAGMQSALGAIRSAGAAPDVLGQVYGDLSKLPCGLSGNVDGLSDGITYSVQVSYFTTDPTGTTPAWQAANKLACSAVSGVTVQPKFALIDSQGSAPGIPNAASVTDGNRNISAIYSFKVSNANVAGGRIYETNRNYCMQAVSATVGSTVRFVEPDECTNDALELWIYDTDYKIKLANTTAGGLAGLCITGPVTWGGGTQNAILQPCLGNTDPARWNQLWSWTNIFYGQNQTISAGLSSYCLSSGTAPTGTTVLQVRQGCSGTLRASSAVGAGAAGYSTHQIVNYKEFGRCADVTNESIGYSFMISYPCKQDATGTGARLLWNHKWYYSEPASGVPSLGNQQIYVYLNDDVNRKYCFTTPTPGNGGYPVFGACNGSAQQKWTRVYNTGTYLTSYLFKDNYGRCLAADSANAYNGLWSKLVVATCNGGDAQKWNAPPTYSDSTISTYKEVSG